jgi:pilus assembly protein CpaE
VLETTIVKVDDGPDILARPRNIADAHRVSGETVRETLRVAAESYGHVIMDLPRKLDEITGVGIEMCDRLLLVVQLTVPSVDNAARLLDTLSGEGIGRERVDLVINRFRKKVHSCTVEMVEKQLNLKSIGTIPSDYSSVNRALDAGVLLSPKSAVRTSIADLAQKLLGAAHARSRDSKLGLAKGVS